MNKNKNKNKKKWYLEIIKDSKLYQLVIHYSNNR